MRCPRTRLYRHIQHPWLPFPLKHHIAQIAHNPHKFPPKKMTSWKEREQKERRTPFLSRGMGRTTHLEERATVLEERASLLEERADALETLAADHLSVAFVEELPSQPNPDTIYFICSAP